MRCGNVEWSAIIESAPLAHPFGYGRVRLQAAEILWLRCECAAGVGISVSLLAPDWFDRSPRSAAAKRSALLEAVAEAARDLSPVANPQCGSSFLAARDRAVAAYSMRQPQSLIAAFGLAMAEAACLDAWCRDRGSDLATAIRCAWFHDDEWCAEALPPVVQRVGWRHTIGLQDPVNGQTHSALERVVTDNDCRWFKIKVDDSPATLPRLMQIGELLDGCLVGDYAVTLDGNESFESVDALRSFCTALGREPSLRSLVARVCWMEQPLARAIALPAGDRERAELKAALTELADCGLPVVLDESGDGEDTLQRGLERGYAGISAKVCKGVVRAVRHAVQARSRGAVVSAEDLTCPAGPALHRHLGLASALGIDHAEVNGLHYLIGGGLAGDDERSALVHRHPELYDLRGGRLGLRLDEDGRLDVGRVAASAFGAEPIRPTGWRPLSRELE